MDAKRQLVIVEDDEAFARTLKRSFERRDYEVRVAPGPDAPEALLTGWRPDYAVVDLKLGNAFGLSRSGEHTSELQSIMRISYDVFCMKKTNNRTPVTHY